MTTSVKTRKPRPADLLGQRTTSAIPTGAAGKVPNLAPEVIRLRAFEIFTERSRKGQPGDPVSDWLRAERELAAGKQV